MTTDGDADRLEYIEVKWNGLIASAPSDIAWLISEVRRLRSELRSDRGEWEEGWDAGYSAAREQASKLSTNRGVRYSIRTMVPEGDDPSEWKPSTESEWKPFTE